jgi:serine/threonine protein kinase
VSVLGTGGFASVWKAYDRVNRSLVAVKILHGQYASDASRRERFFRGARKMHDLRHVGIMPVVQPYGDDSGWFYFVMELAEAGDFHDAVLQHRVDATTALRLISAAADGLHHAHEKGMVHRDVTPSNILLRADGSAVMSDFDLVRAFDTTGGTRTGAMGKYVYAAPELMTRPQDVDRRADVYGLGMTTVFAIYGQDLANDVVRNGPEFIRNLDCIMPLQNILAKAAVREV